MAKICQDHQNPFPEGPEVPEGRLFQKWFVQNLFRSLLSGILRVLRGSAWIMKSHHPGIPRVQNEEQWKMPFAMHAGEVRIVPGEIQRMQGECRAHQGTQHRLGIALGFGKILNKHEQNCGPNTTKSLHVTTVTPPGGFLNVPVWWSLC